MLHRNKPNITDLLISPMELKVGGKRRIIQIII